MPFLRSDSSGSEEVVYQQEAEAESAHSEAKESAGGIASFVPFFGSRPRTSEQLKSPSDNEVEEGSASQGNSSDSRGKDARGASGVGRSFLQLFRQGNARIKGKKPRASAEDKAERAQQSAETPGRNGWPQLGHSFLRFFRDDDNDGSAEEQQQPAEQESNRRSWALPIPFWKH